MAQARLDAGHELNDKVKTFLRILAAVLFAGALAFWATAGANRGWTKTGVQVKTVDEVTGLEDIRWKDAFLPGVDFLVAALLGAGILTGVSFLIRTKPNSPIKQTGQ